MKYICSPSGKIGCSAECIHQWQTSEKINVLLNEGGKHTSAPGVRLKITTCKEGDTQIREKRDQRKAYVQRWPQSEL